MSAPTFTVTKIRCPACAGRGRSSLISSWRCSWCDGEKKADRTRALQWADVTWTFFVDGYIAGDYTLEEMRAMEAHAQAIAAVFGEPDRYKPKPGSSRP